MERAVNHSIQLHSIKSTKQKRNFLFSLIHLISWKVEWNWMEQIKKYYNSMDNTDHTGWKLEEMKNF